MEDGRPRPSGCDPRLRSPCLISKTRDSLAAILSLWGLLRKNRCPGSKLVFARTAPMRGALSPTAVHYFFSASLP